MDLNVYEDDDDETLHRKLIAAKIARKRAEEDHKLLSNRIALLKQEEQKVCKSLTNPACELYRHGRSSTRPRNAPLISSLPSREIWRSSKKERPSNVKRKRKRPSANKSTLKSKRSRGLLLRCSVAKLKTKCAVRQTT